MSLDSCRKAVVWIVLACFALPSFTVHPVIAQDSNFDFEAPTLVFEETLSGVQGETQVITVTATDNVAIERVTLRYRFGDDKEFLEGAMSSLGDSSIYTYRIPAKAGETDRIEYYFEAEDTAGNVALKGYAFDPYVRSLRPESTDDPTADSPADNAGRSAKSSRAAESDRLETAGTPVEPPLESESKGSKIWYYVVGALVIGAVAAAGGGGGGGGGGGSPADDPDCCTVTLGIDTP